MSTSTVLGPRVSADELRAHRARYRIPSLLFLLSTLALIASIFVPYWTLHLKAPQFPKGLRVDIYANRVVGHEDPVTHSNDLEQIDELNHYVGMPSLQDGGKLEKAVSIEAIVVFAGLLVAAVYVHSKWALLAALPALLFPIAFLADLQYWLWHYGHSLDPRAPLASAVGEFTPHLLGRSKIAQFDTRAVFGPGLYIAFGVSVLVAIALVFHRRAYRPLAGEGDAPSPEAAGSS